MAGKVVCLDVDYTPPLDWDFFARHLGGRATRGVEMMEGNSYCRSIEIDGRIGCISIVPSASDHQFQVKITGEARKHPEVVADRVRRMLDLNIDLAAVHQTLKADPILAPLLAAYPGIRVPGAWSRFEVLVRTIVGQQVTVKAATTIMGRLASRFGQPTGLSKGPEFVFPTPAQIAEGGMEGIGMPGKRVAALQTVARAIAENRIPSFDTAPATEIRQALMTMPGIGPWTMEYFSLKALGDADAWPGTDLVLKRVVEQMSAGKPGGADLWRPYRGYAAMHLWNRASQANALKESNPASEVVK
ncbi:DNA-3-methyladenine glycosylase family protein [Zavarzinella formosa]|uniref:DNA-3-methyladenine glycosylase family protein n=1 Tax=Zavarzinella formosa TaxID=360055 RepID=UPI0002DFDB89|nr:AlkA N-terminal domain-containing protein [Zavarzinella formosa]